MLISKMPDAQHDPLLLELFKEALLRQLQGSRNLALIAYKRIQEQFPGFVDGWTNASVVLCEMGRYAEALDMALRAVETGPENPSAYCALANARQSLGDFDDAVVNFQKALEYDPAHFPALTNLAGIYVRDGNFAAALELDTRAIQAKPSQSALWVNRGYTKLWALDMAGAEADLKHALELSANNALARWNLAYVHMLQNRYREAWPNFKAREELPEWSGNRDRLGFEKPRWNGEELKGRALLIYSEQGFGDTIQFARFIPRLRQYGGRVLLLTYEPLKRFLTAYLPDIDGLIMAGAPLPPFDAVIPLMDLPMILKANAPELAPLPPPILPGCEPLPELDRPGLKAGLVWAGNPTHLNDAQRSINPRHLDALADMKDIAWYGLQKPPSDEPPELPGFIDMSPRMGDFMDTAQIARQLDLIVTVDTSVAHLAGSLGLPTFVLLPYLPDWRWSLNSQQTPWYPTLTLLRQPTHGDWQSVISTLKKLIQRHALY